MHINLALVHTCYALDTHMDQHRNPLVVLAFTICLCNVGCCQVLSEQKG